MLYPAMSELLKHVESRYLLVNVVAHEPLTDKPVTIAINEVARGELTATLKEKYRK